MPDPLSPLLVRLVSALLALGLATGCSTSPPSSAEQTAKPSAALAGQYNGSQMEMAAGLELSPDGRFRYMLSYGALDELAEGNWVADAQGVRLTSDPVRPPRFALVESSVSPDGGLSIGLDLPEGLSPQYFSALFTMPDGQSGTRQMTRDGLDLELGADSRPVSVSMVLDVYGIVGEPIALPQAGGARLRFRFEPNDLGKVGFSNQPLRLEDGTLLLERHGRLIRFRRD